MKFLTLTFFAILAIASSTVAECRRANIPFCLVSSRLPCHSKDHRLTLLKGSCVNASIAASGCLTSDLRCLCNHHSALHQSVHSCVKQWPNCTDPTGRLRCMWTISYKSFGMKSTLITPAALGGSFAKKCFTMFNITVLSGKVSVPFNGSAVVNGTNATTPTRSGGLRSGSGINSTNSTGPSPSATPLSAHTSATFINSVSAIQPDWIVAVAASLIIVALS